MVWNLNKLAARLLPGICSALCLSCVVPAGHSPEPLTFAHASSADTLSPFEPLKFVFSEPLDDSAVLQLDFQPPCFSYYILMNKTRDTAQVIPSEPFTGDQRYVVRIRENIQGKSGAMAEATTDSAVFYTDNIEREPNNTPATADTLIRRCYGSLQEVDDRDLFYIGSIKAGNAVVLISQGSQSTMLLEDATGKSVVPDNFSITDTLRIPSDFIFPVIASVSSWQKSAGGFYCIECVSRSK